MKILWLCNRMLFKSEETGTGGWLGAMAESLLKYKNNFLELANITFGNVSHVTETNVGGIKQWIVPSGKAQQHGDSLPYLSNIFRIIEQYTPDVIHVWGTETFFGLITARGYVDIPSVLEMQGLVGAYAKVYHSDLTLQEQIRCTGLKEILKSSMIIQQAQKYKKWGIIEKEIIRGHQFIITQSDWMQSQIKHLSSQNQCFQNARILRKPFYESTPWNPALKRNIIFCSAAYPVPYKGLHVALRSISILKKRVPDIQIRIAGVLQKKGIRMDGYMRWINHLIKKLNIEANVFWLGGLNADQISCEMLNASAMVLPSFIENCSNALQEAMLVGLPVVTSYAGGSPSLVKDEESALFFSPGDEVMCASQLERLMTDSVMSVKLSKKARNTALKRNDPFEVVNRQFDIYKTVIEEFSTKK